MRTNIEGRRPNAADKINPKRKRRANPGRTMAFYCPDPLRRRLEAAAAKGGCSISYVIQRALDGRLDVEPVVMAGPVAGELGRVILDEDDSV